MWTLISFLAFTVFVGVVSWYKTKGDSTKSADGYFLAGRGLTGIVIAGSMLLTNINAEQLVGLSGQAYAKNISGLAWESTAAVSCIVLASLFLPMYLRRGFTTMPQFLEERFDANTRRLISSIIIIGYILVTTPGALYSGAVAFNQVFNFQELFGLSYAASIWALVWIIGIIGSIYAIFGGLKAVAISDTINGVGLIVGGLAVPIFGLLYIGNGNIANALTTLITEVPEKFNAVGGASDPVPFGTVFTGMIAANLFYWCTNQVLIQRTLGAVNLKEGQKGVLISGFAKLMIPLIVCFPGIIAYYIFLDNPLPVADAAYPTLIALVLPKALTGLYCGVIFGAVLSTYNSLLNSAATLFCFDIYKSAFNKNISDEKLIKFAKVLGTILAVFSMIIAPLTMYAQGGIYEVMRRFTGFFNIPTISIVLVGLFTKKVPPIAPKIAAITHIILYSLAIFVFKIPISYLHIMGILFVFNVSLMLIIGKLAPLATPYSPEKRKPNVDMRPWKKAPIAMSILMGTLVFTYVGLSNIGIANPDKTGLVGDGFIFGIIAVIVTMVVVYFGATKYIAKMEADAIAQEKEMEDYAGIK